MNGGGGTGSCCAAACLGMFSVRIKCLFHLQRCRCHLEIPFVQAVLLQNLPSTVKHGNWLRGLAERKPCWWVWASRDDLKASSAVSCEGQGDFFMRKWFYAWVLAQPVGLGLIMIHLASILYDDLLHLGGDTNVNEYKKYNCEYLYQPWPFWTVLHVKTVLNIFLHPNRSWRPEWLICVWRRRQ